MRRILALLLVLAIGVAAVQTLAFSAAIADGSPMAVMDETMPGCDGCDPDQQAPMTSCHACAHFPAVAPVFLVSAPDVLALRAPDAVGHGRTMSPEPHPPKTGSHS